MKLIEQDDLERMNRYREILRETLRVVDGSWSLQAALLRKRIEEELAAKPIVDVVGCLLEQGR